MAMLTVVVMVLTVLVDVDGVRHVLVLLAGGC